MNLFNILEIIGLALAVSPYVYKYFLHIRRLRIVKSFWDGEKKDYIIIYPTHKDTTSLTEEFRLMKHEDVSATRRLQEFLQDTGHNVELKRSVDSLSDKDKTANIVIIGSSRTNPSVKVHFPQVEEEFSFGVLENEYYIFDKEKQIRLVSPLDKGISADLALMVKLRNPYQINNKVYYIAGIHGMGTWAAAEYVTDINNLRNLPKVSATKGIACVIETNFSGFYKITRFANYIAPRVL